MQVGTYVFGLYTSRKVPWSNTPGKGLRGVEKIFGVLPSWSRKSLTFGRAIMFSLCVYKVLSISGWSYSEPRPKQGPISQSHNNNSKPALNFPHTPLKEPYSSLRTVVALSAAGRFPSCCGLLACKRGCGTAAVNDSGGANFRCQGRS